MSSDAGAGRLAEAAGDPAEPIAWRDISAYADGGTGVPYLHGFDSGRPGLHAVILALTHGNEFGGMVALIRLLEAGVRPVAGRLSLCFVNVDAYARFDPARPVAGRFVDRDMNRLWADEIIDADRASSEAARARQIRPLVRDADRLLDLHSVFHGGRPFFVTPDRPRLLELAGAIGLPSTRVILKPGGMLGPTIMDYPTFAREGGGAAAVVAECGRHFDRSTAELATACAARFLAVCGTIAPATARALAPPVEPGPPADYEVTHDVFAETDGWRYVRRFEGFDPVEEGELVAWDGDRPVRAPHPDCVVLLARPFPKAGGEAMTFGRRVERTARRQAAQ
jgi:predicted deacylase